MYKILLILFLSLEIFAGTRMCDRGVVIKLLKDDNKGSRHQRFILKLANDKTLLIAHNIDIAPKIETLQKDDIVNFCGEFEPNKKGGVVHWTHHDPRGKHIGGWLEHKNKKYE